MRNKIFILTAMFFLVISTGEAHGLATEKNEVVGNYLVQMEYDTLGDISAGETTSFNFELLDPETKESITFDRVFVQISKKVGDYPLVFSSNLHPLDRGATLSANATIFIPVEGAYQAKLNYYENEKELVSKTFEINAKPPYKDSNWLDLSSKYILSLLMLIFGMVVGFWMSKATRVSQKE